MSELAVMYYDIPPVEQVYVAPEVEIVNHQCAEAAATAGDGDVVRHITESGDVSFMGNMELSMQLLCIDDPEVFDDVAALATWIAAELRERQQGTS